MPGPSTIGVLGLTAPAPGRYEKRLRAEVRPSRAVHTHAASRAGYHPGAARADSAAATPSGDGEDRGFPDG